MTSAVSIVIPNWNGLEFLERFLPSVIAAASHYSRQSSSPTEIVIVDDGSTDSSVAWLRDHGCEEAASDASDRNSGGAEERRSGGDKETGRGGDRVEQPALRLLRNETNRGFGPTCNRGFQAARYSLVFLLNNDVDVELNAIAPLVENFEDASVFAAHCRVFDIESEREVGTGKLGSFARGFIRVHRSYVPNKKATTSNGDRLYSMFASGGSAMFSREKFLDIGGFDSLLAPIYWEDVDISYRAWKRGLWVVYEPRSVVHHRVSSTMRKVNKRRVSRMQQRHRLIYHWVNLHEGRLIASHIAWVALLSFTAPLRFQLGFLLSVASALRALPGIRKRRLEEKRAARRTDRQVFEIFASLEKRADVFAYDDYADLETLRAKER